MPMMVITTSSSTSVKPCLVRFIRGSGERKVVVVSAMMERHSTLKGLVHPRLSQKQGQCANVLDIRTRNRVAVPPPDFKFLGSFLPRPRRSAVGPPVPGGHWQLAAPLRVWVRVWGQTRLRDSPVHSLGSRQHPASESRTSRQQARPRLRTGPFQLAWPPNTDCASEAN